jgi:hypothetical protein
MTMTDAITSPRKVDAMSYGINDLKDEVLSGVEL